MFNRRQLIGTASVSALALTTGRSWADTESAAENLPLLASPPVVQHPLPNSFGVSIAVSGLATAWVEWGWEQDKLDQLARASTHGLIAADDRVLHIRVQHDRLFPTGQPIYYRVVAQPLRYQNAYKLERGEAQATKVFELRLPDYQRKLQTIAVINDTHENSQSLAALQQRVEALNPDLLIWNGDTCNDFDEQDRPEQILLNPLSDTTRGFAATRPLVYVPGNHDVRGVRAREVLRGLPAWPGQTDLPYNQALRLGPLAMFLLDTGEDKPDAHPVFAGTASYEPYRASQALWLEQNLQQPHLSTAPLKLAFCHIPLRGRPGQNDGTTLSGYAAYSGFGAKLWLPHLRKAQCQCVVSGHTHRPRFDDPSADEPIAQLVGGGPQPGRARLIVIKTDEQNGKSVLHIESSTLSGEVTHSYKWEA